MTFVERCVLIKLLNGSMWRGLSSYVCHVIEATTTIRILPVPAKFAVTPAGHTNPTQVSDYFRRQLGWTGLYTTQYTSLAQNRGKQAAKCRMFVHAEVQMALYYLSTQRGLMPLYGLIGVSKNIVICAICFSSTYSLKYSRFIYHLPSISRGYKTRDGHPSRFRNWGHT